VIAGTLFTLFIVPAAYDLVGRYSASPKAVSLQLEKELEENSGSRNSPDK
jgi:multidrug efflux pump